MEIQQLSTDNLNNLIDLVLELWADGAFDEEYENYKRILHLDNEVCYLIKEQGIYIAFIHLLVSE